MDKKCFRCGRECGLERHHVFFGVANRKKSEKYKLVVYLCVGCHRGNTGVHFNREFDLQLKRLAQSKFEETHTREEFLREFGRNYL